MGLRKYLTSLFLTFLCNYRVDYYLSKTDIGYLMIKTTLQNKGKANITDEEKILNLMAIDEPAYVDDITDIANRVDGRFQISALPS